MEYFGIILATVQDRAIICAATVVLLEIGTVAIEDRMVNHLRLSKLYTEFKPTFNSSIILSILKLDI